MSDTNEPLGPREQRLVTEISALPDVPAREDFRARLRAQFVAGEIPETSSEAPAADGDGKVIPFAVRVAFPLALAAVLAGLFVVLNRGPAWHALDPTSVARLRVVGRIAPDLWDEVAALVGRILDRRSDREARRVGVA